MRDKQIEEMAKIMCDNCGKTFGEKCENLECVFCKNLISDAEALYNAGYRKASDIFEEIEKQLARYSHLHRYAEEARQVTEEFADGTPCKMTSVWDALPLHKNGWDDYETMNKLQENIEVIENSRLLKEFEGDIAKLKKKYEILNSWEDLTHTCQVEIPHTIESIADLAFPESEGEG